MERESSRDDPETLALSLGVPTTGGVEMSETVNVGDRFEWVEPDPYVEMGVYEVVEKLPHAWKMKGPDGRVSPGCFSIVAGGKLGRGWRRLPSSQPERVELPDRPGLWRDNYGFDWRTQQTLSGLEFRYEGSKAEPCGDPCWGNYEPAVSFGPYTLISTGEAETGSLTGAVVAPAAPVEKPRCVSCNRGGEWPERYVKYAPATAAAKVRMCDPCYLKDEQANAQLTLSAQRLLDSAVSAPKSEPSYQPHWQRTGAVSTYSRRVPR